jgi:hypothetical protein
MTIFTAIDPNGVTHTRNSKARTYTHMVVGRPSSVEHALMVTSPKARAVHRSNFKYHDAIAKGTSQWLIGLTAAYRDVEIANAKNHLNGCDTAQDYETMMVNASLEPIRHNMARGYYDKYQALGWCGRPDLAAKLKVTSENRKWVDVTILETKIARPA